MKKYIWIGAEGFNPEVGMVYRGASVELDDSLADRFLEKGYIQVEEATPPEKPKNKPTKTKE